MTILPIDRSKFEEKPLVKTPDIDQTVNFPLSIERSTPVHFESDSSWQTPFNHDAKGIPSYFSLGVSSDTSDLLTRFLGKYLKWTPSD